MIIGLNMLSALEVPEKKFKVVFIENFNVSYSTGTSLYFVAKKFKNYSFTLFVDNIKSKNVLNELKEAIDVLKSSEDFRKIAYKFVGQNVLTKPQETIIKKTYGVREDFSGKTLLIIDTHNQYHRNWHGMPDMRNTADEPTSVVKAFTTLVKGLDKYSADYVIFASEGKDGIRYQIDSEYKATRSDLADDLRFQMRACDHMTKKMGFSLISETGFEADDIMGSYTRTFEKLGGKVIIITSDKDMYQLMSNNVKIYDPFKKKYITNENCLAKMEVLPEKVVYSLAIQGDVSDNVPGVPGVGKKGAAKLLEEYGNIEGIIANIPNMKKSKQKENLENGIEDLRKSFELVRLYDFLADDVDFNQFKFPTYNPFMPVQEELEKYEINI